jgi:hypothetical protein
VTKAELKAGLSEMRKKYVYTNASEDERDSKDRTGMEGAQGRPDHRESRSRDQIYLGVM